MFFVIAAIAIAMLGMTAYAADDITVYVLGNEVQFDVQPEIANGRTMVPVRAIFEVMGCEVRWDDATRTVVVLKELIDTTNVTFDGAIDGSPRIMIVGNYITRHAPSSSTGWNGNYGMAASSIENDYVHILISRVRTTHPNAVFCIVQAGNVDMQTKIYLTATMQHLTLHRIL